MKRSLLFSLCALLLLGAFANCQNASAPPDTIPAEINAVSDWGITPGPGNGKANSLILAEKLHVIADNTDVLFPEGLYEIAFPMYLLQKSGVRIIGQNATILRTDVTNTSASQAPMDDPDIPEDIRPYTASSSIFVIDGCQNVCVQGFTFKYDIPSSLSGTVLSKEGDSVVLEITDTTQFTGEEYVTIINTFTKNGVPDKKLEQYAATNFPAQKLSDNTLRVTGLDPGGVSRLSKGTRVCLRLATASDYVIKVSGSKDLTFSDLTMHNSLNGGIFVSGRCENVTLSGVTVKPESELSLMSLNADILHISALGGSLLVKDCIFERPGDDCVNVHDMAYMVDNVKDDSATVSAPRFSFSSTWAKPGDMIEFFDGETFACLGSATVTATLDNTYTFDELPDGVTAGTVISNKAMRPAVTIQNTTVQSNRARGFLLQTENAVVENCTFKDTALAAILLAPDLEYWYEMSPSKNVVIRNNTFENCGEYASGIIQIATNHDSPTMTYPSYVHQDIVIQNNTFSSGCRTALFGVCIDTLTFTDNDFSGFKGKFASLRYCTNVTLDEQTRENSSLTNVTE
ncbi:MAG: right-handed parallel beta-helix repeat-containing protein [Ruminococcaceae bacterium]|nr:right-handed parallel beta-helix repeat-containing protein [Oscillospiraceae bacterium]MBE6697000.1 right-handed parallel beta-helix repeat-containing protein [Oscillospiraceae bacterium]